MNKKPWTDTEFEVAVAIVKECATVPQACARITTKLKRTVDVSNLRALFVRRGLVSPAELVGRVSAVDRVESPIPSPLERRERETAASRLKKEHGQLVDQLAESNRRESLRQALAAAPLPPIRRRELGSGLREGTFVAGLSDLHSEEMVVPSASTFDNAYSLEICDLRLGRFFSSVEWLINSKRPAFQLRDVVLWYGGDLMTGHLHDENVETGQLSQVETILWLMPRLVAGVRQILRDEQIEVLTLVCSYGNHGRNTKKPMRARGAQHSYEWMMYQQIADALKPEIAAGRVRVLADPSAHQYVQVYDYTVHFHHGDETNYGGGVGGIMIPLNKAIAQWNKVRRADLNNFGHWHQLIQTGDMTVNGCGIGYNAYGMSIKASPEPAQQFSYIIDSKRCKCEMTPIWLEDRSAENALRVARGWAPWQTKVGISHQYDELLAALAWFANNNVDMTADLMKRGPEAIIQRAKAAA